jgi:Flp pilus assembly protein TadG
MGSNRSGARRCGAGARLRRAHARRAERGAAALEFALVVPVLVMLLVGIVTGGVTYSRGIALTDAVRESARFGATGDATTPATWASDVIAQERATQIDDLSQGTAVCVQLWKGTAAAGAAVTGSTVCDQGTFGTPPLTATDTSFPAVPSSVVAGTCVVRVLAARKWTIDIPPFPSVSGTMKRGAVARYERSTC